VASQQVNRHQQPHKLRKSLMVMVHHHGAAARFQRVNTLLTCNLQNGILFA